MSSEEVIAFSENQQSAVIGHALAKPAIWDILYEFGINDKWLISPVLVDTWKHIADFKNDFNKYPVSVEELVDSVKDELLKAALKRSVLNCLEARKRHSWDTLEQKLVTWAKSRTVFVGVKEIAMKYNEGKHEEAYELFQKHSLQIEKIDAIAGTEPDGFISSADRVKDEERERKVDTSNIITYSVPYLQDALGGTLPTDVVLVGATSGAGKTEWGKIQAAHIAEQGHPAHYFALEAEPYEIERRIKYGMLGSWYKEDHPVTPEGMICYKNFRFNRLENEFASYQQRCNDEFNKKYKTLYTYYRKRGDFGLKELDREMFKLKGKSKAIILDHIHFVDLESDNETREMSELIKRIRQIAGSLEIPVYCIAHINKAANRNDGLIPKKEDFYGAGNLFKTATTAIMMAPCHGMVSCDSRAQGKPTFMRIVKCRVDGSVLYNPAISFFNTWTSNYTPYYSAGRLYKGDRQWKSLKGDLPYWVDIEKHIVDINDIES